MTKLEVTVAEIRKLIIERTHNPRNQILVQST